MEVVQWIPLLQQQLLSEKSSENSSATTANLIGFSSIFSGTIGKAWKLPVHFLKPTCFYKIHFHFFLFITSIGPTFYLFPNRIVSPCNCRGNFRYTLNLAIYELRVRFVSICRLRGSLEHQVSTCAAGFRQGGCSSHEHQ